MGIDFGKILIKQFKEKHCLDWIPCTYHGTNGENDCNGCTHPKHPTQLAKKAAEEKAQEVHVEAFDEKGNIFDKVVEFRDGDQGMIIDFGWPCSYYIESLLGDGILKTDLCIDAGGANHRGSAVYLKKDDVNKLIAAFRPV